MEAPSDNAPPTQASSLASKLQISEEVERRCNIIKSVGEQCINDDELRDLLAKKAGPVCYDGFEPSGRMHIAQGLMKIMNVNKLTSAGCRVKIWIADWFAFMNNKLGGDLKKIRIVGEYYKEIFQAAGMNGENVEFLWSSDEINARGDEYWPLVMDIACRNSLAKIKRCMPIMGHSETDELSAAHVLYVCMQCADPLFLEADICQLGMDQQTVNLLARDYCDETERGNKPVILSHHMLPTKMSKSDSSSAIFMDDDEVEVNRKIKKKAYCPPKIVEGNPCLEYVKYIILPWFNEFTVERDEKHGGNKTFNNFEDIAADYESDKLHPMDLKNALSKALNNILQPVRDHFKTNNGAKNLLKQVTNLLKQDQKTNRVVPTELSSEMEALSVNAPSSAAGLEMSEEVEIKYNIVRSIGEECIQEDELKNLLSKKPTPICYDGFEPSGRMHIAQGVMKVTNVNKLTSAGCQVKIWIADWFAQLNNKLGGDLEKIKVVGEYFKEIWQAGGMNLEKVAFLWASEEISSRGNKYWPLVMDIARRNNLPLGSRSYAMTRPAVFNQTEILVSSVMSSVQFGRLIKELQLSVWFVNRCGQIMGRSETEVLSAAQILYPCMQCADIFFLEADICQLGMDQRKVNMLAREYCDDIKRKNKPIILSHHMLPGLLEGQEKMSKSNPSSAIFMEDEEDAVNEKISQAHCPLKTVVGNPCLEYVKYLVLPRFNELVVEQNDGNKTFTSFEDIAADYESGELSEEDLKKALIKALNIMLQPVRDHFKTNERAKNLLEQVRVMKCFPPSCLWFD
uniref:tyrosine--tRNA ligase n=1 Tax=Brassica campestris TaxID=3711 RepID=M4D330_BRACM